MLDSIWFSYLSTILVWTASVVAIVHGFILADTIADRVSPSGGNFKHGNSPHKKRLLFFGIRNFLILLAAVIMPGTILYFSLSNPALFFQTSSPVVLNQMNGTASSNWGIGIFVIDTTLQGVAGDVLEVFSLELSSNVVAHSGVDRLLSMYRLIMSIFGATAFFSFLYVLVDWALIKVPLPWKTKKNESFKINLSGLSRGYAESNNQVDHSQVD